MFFERGPRAGADRAVLPTFQLLDNAFIRCTGKSDEVGLVSDHGVGRCGEGYVNEGVLIKGAF